MIHRFVDFLSTVLMPSTVFQVSNTVSGTDTWDDIWAVPFNAGGAVKVTDHSSDLGVYDDVPIESPDRSYIAYQRFSDLGPDDAYLRVIKADGTGDTQLVGASIQDHRWIDNNWIMYLNSSLTELRKINKNGTGDQAIVTKALDRACPSPDGTQIAYIVSGGPSSLWIVDSDGTNDTQLLSDIGNGITGPPVWRLDGSAILYPNGNGTYRMETIAPDGTGQTTVASPMPTGFWDQSGMYDDRFFFTNTVTGLNWKLGQIIFGSGASLVSPTLSLSRSVHRGIPVVDNGRVFSVQDGSLMGGVDSMVSVLPDGSDLVLHFNPDESGSPLFQNIAFR